MEVLKAIKERRSVREFEPGPVAGDVVDKLIEALIWAPSAGNLQSRKFYFVSSPGIKKELSDAALGQGFVASAPLVVVACADLRIRDRYGARGAGLYAIQDASASVMCMMLEALELGLGTVWVGAFREEAVSKALQLPDYLRPVALVPVGYPVRAPRRPPARASKSEAVTFIGP